jgi:hypothetical protein
MDTAQRLLAERVGARFGLFFVTGEGALLPDGSEETTGYLVDAAGRVFRFALGWDRRRNALVIDEWQQVEPPASWHDSDEYREALAEAGLDAA